MVIEVYPPPHKSRYIPRGEGPTPVSKCFCLVSFYVSVRCNNSQFTFEYFNCRLLKQTALLNSIFHLKFLKLNLAKTTLNLSKDIGKTRGLRVQDTIHKIFCFGK